MKNNSVFTLFILFAVLFTPAFVRAEIPVGGIRQQLRKEIIQEKKEAVREEIREEIKENRQNLLERAKEIIKEKVKRQLKGELVSIAGSVLTVQKDQTTYTVNTTEKTQLKRKFGANASLAEFSPKDKLLIIGKRVKNTDGTLSGTTIDASYIRNMSIQRRFLVFNGIVTAKTDSTITIKTTGRGEQTAYVSSSTKYTERNKTITLSDIQVGDRLIVKGELWDRANEKIDAKSVLKLPVRPISPTPSPTISSAQ